MNVLYLIKSFALKAGTERVISDKMNYLASRGYHVMLVTYEQGDNSNAFELDNSILQRDLSTCFYLLYKHSLLRRIIERRFMKHVFLKRLQLLVDDFKPQIIVTTTYGVFKYKIYETRVIDAKDNNAFPFLYDQEILMIYTCYPVNTVGHKTHRFLVYAKKVGESFEK